MGKSLLDLYPEESGALNEQELPFAYLENRSESWKRLGRRPGFDLLVIGAGIVGASAALAAALNGIRVALVQKGAYPTSVAPSWIELVKQLDSLPLLRSAQALGRLDDTVQDLERSAPLALNAPERLCLGRVRRALSRVIGPGRTCRMPDIDRLVRALVFTARQEGAVCLNHATALFVESDSVTGGMMVGVESGVDGATLEVQCGAILVDPEYGLLPGSRLAREPIWCPVSPLEIEASVTLFNSGGCFIPQGWAPWEYEACVSFALAEIRKEGGLIEKYVPIGSRPLPLLTPDVSVESSFRGQALEASVSEDAVLSAIHRWGALSRHIPAYPDGLHELRGPVLLGELNLARDVLQAVTISDLRVALKLDADAVLADEVVERWG
jgi:hypothetical protein